MLITQETESHTLERTVCCEDSFGQLHSWRDLVDPRPLCCINRHFCRSPFDGCCCRGWLFISGSTVLGAACDGRCNQHPRGQAEPSLHPTVLLWSSPATTSTSTACCSRTSHVALSFFSLILHSIMRSASASSCSCLCSYVCRAPNVGKHLHTTCNVHYDVEIDPVTVLCTWCWAAPLHSMHHGCARA